MATFAVACVVRATSSVPAQEFVPLRAGMVITQSTTVPRSVYHLAAPRSLDSAVITIRGNDITLDLNGSTILGAEHGTDPDQRTGVAIRVEGGSNITIKNGAIHGYRIDILARGTRAVTVRALDLSRTWKPRLYSLVEHESIVDWLSFHQNERREWMRYGAAIYLDSVSAGEITGVTAEQGMNGVLCVRCSHVDIHDNTLRFNSGLGVGFYRSSENQIRHNRLDFNVRGYSEGFYSRGQDSADLLFFEQSSDNDVELNSATHGGDGFFLWAGQHTMDTGDGGANGNAVSRNDFSFATANAIEATFSSNSFVSNRASGSDYGVWAGYSYRTDFLDNCLVGDRTGIAIEHGQRNAILGNRIDSATVGVRLWADSIAASDWGYPKHHATASDSVRIEQNAISRARVGLELSNTASATIVANRFHAVDTLLKARDTAAIRFDSAGGVAASGSDACDRLPARSDAELTSDRAFAAVNEIPSSPLARRGRAAMIVDEWGPFDWRSPKLWPIDSTRAVPLRLAVIGPPGKWRVRSSHAVDQISKRMGAMNDTITVTPARTGLRDWEITLEYTGGLVVTPDGDSVPPGQPALFSYSSFETPQWWTVRIRSRADSTLLDSLEVPRLDIMWYRPRDPKIPLTNWTLDATGELALPSGVYTLRTISDDGVRVWLDGRIVIDDWGPHESKVDVASLSGGRHEVRVQYQQIDGWAELRLDVLRGTQRAGGSPGPH
jgi:hypothetical protein